MESARLNNYYKFLLVSVLVMSLISFISAGESQLQVTQEHPFLVDGKWISASQLQAGDELTTIDGKKARITSIEDVVSPYNFLVYNLEAGEYSNFVVGDEDLGVVVHNSDAGAYSIGLREKEYIETNFDKVYEWKWSRRYPFEGRIEKILIDYADPVLAAKIKTIYQDTFGILSANPSENELYLTAMDFNLRVREQLPFLGSSGTANLLFQSDASWVHYLDLFKDGPIKLSELGANKMLDCTGQVLTIQESLPGEGWALYRDIPFDDLAGRWLIDKPRAHTFLAKKFGDLAVIIDPLEAFVIPQTHGLTKPWVEFIKLYPEAKLAVP